MMKIRCSGAFLVMTLQDEAQLIWHFTIGNKFCNLYQFGYPLS